MDIKLIIDDPSDTETVSRRILSDIQTSDTIKDASFAMSAAQAGDRGILQNIGTLGMKLLDTGGAGFIFDVLRPMLSVGRSETDDKRSIIMELPQGQRLELHGGMSDEDFMATQERLISIMEKAAGGGTA